MSLVVLALCRPADQVKAAASLVASAYAIGTPESQIERIAVYLDLIHSRYFLVGA